MYVYRNDGDFNAFFFSNIDSITYSQYGEDSVLYDDIEIQVIWTKDSIYRIHTDVIDSISFTQPETKYKKDVILMDSNWLQHIKNIDGMTIIFDSELTQLWTPKNGDILLYEQFDEIFPNGFCGRVSNIISAENYTIVCDSVNDINDVYETLIIFGTYDVVEIPKANGIKEHRLIKKSKNTKKETDISISIPVSENIHITGTLGLTFTPTLFKNGDNFQKFELKIKDTETFNINASFPKDFIDKKLGEEIRLSLPIPNTPLKIITTVAPFIEANLQASLEGNASITVGGSQTISMTLDGFERKTTPRSGSVSYGFSGGLSGELGLGIVPAIGVSMVGDFLSEKINLGISTGLNCEMTLYEGVWDSKEGYRTNKDVTLNWYAAIKAELESQIKVFGFKYTHSTELAEIRANLKTWYFIPQFTEPNCSVDGFQASVSTEIQRQLIIPVKYGIKLYDEGDNIIDTYTNSLTYNGADGKATPIQKIYNSLEYGETYTVVPFFVLFNKEIEAEPTKSFTIEPDEFDIHVQILKNNVIIFDTIAELREYYNNSNIKSLQASGNFAGGKYSWSVRYEPDNIETIVSDYSFCDPSNSEIRTYRKNFEAFLGDYSGKYPYYKMYYLLSVGIPSGWHHFDIEHYYYGPACPILYYDPSHVKLKIQCVEKQNKYLNSLHAE